MFDNISLKLGFMSNEEIINWAQISPNYYLRIRKAWCEKQLSKYAKHRLVKGGVEILEIIEPIYGTTAKKEVEKNFSKCWGHEGHNIDTCKNACRKIQKVLNNKIDVADATIYSYVCLTKREMYGVPKKYEGSIGESFYVYCKIVNNEYIPFTEEEEKIKKELAKKYLCTNTDRIIDLKAIKAAYQNGELEREDYEKAIDEIVDYELGWLAFQEAFEKAIGYPTAFATYLQDNAIKLHGKQDFTF